MKALVAVIGLVVWGVGRYAARNLENFSWPQEVALLLANIGLVIIGTVVVFFFWNLLRQESVEEDL
jgi:hypothetical protein